MEDKESKRTQFLSDKNNKKINLTLAELLFIDDNSTMAINGAEFEGMIPVRVPQATPCTIVTIDFIDKMGKALLKSMKTGATIVSVSDADLYLLREMATSDIVHYGNRVGITIKQKVLNALYSKEITDLTTLEEILKDIDLGE